MNSKAKKKLLIAWGSGYIFEEILSPQIFELSTYFEIHIIIVDYLLEKKTIDQIKLWVIKGNIIEYTILPNIDKVIDLHISMSRVLTKYRKEQFDICLLLSAMQVWERYITDTLLTRNCLKVCYFTNTSPLLNNLCEIEKTNKLQNIYSNYINNCIFKIKNTKNFSNFISIIKHYLCLIELKSKIKILNFIDRYFLPLFVSGHIFPLQKLDWITQLGTDQMDAILLLDPAEVVLYKKFYPNKDIRLVRHPNSGKCKCEGKDVNKKVLLAPLSGLMGSNELPNEYKNIFIRDSKTSLAQTNTSEIHLRTHPRESGIWPKLLCDALMAEGISAKLVGSKTPLRDIVCDYRGVVGFASGAMRDARAACNKVCVILYPDLPKKIYDNQRISMGDAEGIGKVNNDGTYDNHIFEEIIFSGVEKITLVDQLKDMLKIK